MSKIILSEETAFPGRWIKVNRYHVEDSSDHSVKEFECMERGNSVTALVYDPSTDEYLFTEQWRMGAKTDLLELAAGAMDHAGEKPEQTIQREIEEELGYKINPGSLKLLFEFYVSPGGCSEKMFLYYAETGEKISDGGGIDDENIRIVRLKFDQLKNLQQFQDAKTLIGVMWLLGRRDRGLGTGDDLQ